MSGVTGFGSEIFESFKLSNEDEVFILTNKIRDVSRGATTGKWKVAATTTSERESGTAKITEVISLFK